MGPSPHLPHKGWIVIEYGKNLMNLGTNYSHATLNPFFVTNKYPSTLANLTLIILFSELFKFSKIISSKSKNIVKDNNEYLKIFQFLKWKFQN